MELTYPDISALRIEKLHDELLAVGIQPEFVLKLNPETNIGVRLIVPDNVDEGIVNAVMAAHDPDIPSPAEIEFSTDRLTMADLKQQYQNMKDGLVTIRTHMGQIKNGPNSPNAAETGKALKLIADDIIMMTNGLDRLLDTIRIFVKTR